MNWLQTILIACRTSYFLYLAAQLARVQAMYEEDNSVQLISSRSFSHKKAVAPNNEVMLSDSEIVLSSRKNDSDGFEETTVFSDSLYGDSLPSMRAQLAATQMQHRRRKVRSLENSEKETKALLGKYDEDEESAGSTRTVVEVKENGTHGQYKSLGGSIVPKKRARKELITKL